MQIYKKNKRYISYLRKQNYLNNIFTSPLNFSGDFFILYIYN